MKFKILSVLAALLFIVASTINSMACTNFLITAGASTNGSNMITYAADSHVLYGELYFWPATDYPAGTMVDVYEWDTGKFLGKIPQAAHTYTVIGNMNEFQLAIGETTYGGRKELNVNQKGAIMDYGSLIYMTLQRAKTAREAIKIIGDLVEKHGYYSSGESFSIADPNEVWIMEMIGKGENEKGAVWVARQVPDGYVSAHANHARITTFPTKQTKDCIFSADVRSFAKEKGFFKGKDEDFSFSDIYAPVDFGGARFCEARVWAFFNIINKDMGKYVDYAQGKNLKNRMPLWIKPDKKLSLKNVMDGMRDHYEGTPLDMTVDIGTGGNGCPYRWRPLTWKVDGTTYFNERAIATQQTGFSFVSQSRKGLPNPVGGVLWFSVDDAATSVYTPIYCASTEIPETFAVGNGEIMEFSDNAAFWVFNQVSNFAYTRYDAMYPEIKKQVDMLENSFIMAQPSIEKAAIDLYANDKRSGINFLTNYSVNQANMVVSKWKQLYKYLFVKYMDGNVKTKNPKKRNPDVKQPGYRNSFYKQIVKETKDKLKFPGEDK